MGRTLNGAENPRQRRHHVIFSTTKKPQKKSRRQRHLCADGRIFLSGHNTDHVHLFWLVFFSKKIAYITSPRRSSAKQNGRHFFLLFSAICLSFSVKNAIVISVPVRVCASGMVGKINATILTDEFRSNWFRASV